MNKFHLLGTNFGSALTRNLIIGFIWWLTFKPGFFSQDSFAATDMALTGDLNNSFTASWAIYVRLFSILGNSISLLTLINVSVLIYATTTLIFNLLPNKEASITSNLLTLTPLISGMGITLWHDIPMTSGMLLISTALIQLLKNRKTHRSIFINSLIPGSVLLTFRPNGLPTLVLFAICYFAYTRSSTLLKPIAISIIISTLVTLTGSYLVLRETPINNYYGQFWMQYDISCFASTPEGEGFIEENLPVADTETWASSAACSFVGKSNLSSEQINESTKYVPGAWIKLAIQNPTFVLKTHLQRNEYLVPLIIGKPQLVPFLHSTIEIADNGIQWSYPEVAEKARVVMRAWNAARSVVAFSGMWMLLLLIQVLVFKRKEWVIPGIMSFSLSLILFVFAPIPDGRYSLYVLICGQICLISVFLNFWEKLRLKYGKSKKYG
jgi:hypothetical protein